MRAMTEYVERTAKSKATKTILPANRPVVETGAAAARAEVGACAKSFLAGTGQDNTADVVAYVSISVQTDSSLSSVSASTAFIRSGLLSVTRATRSLSSRKRSCGVSCILEKKPEFPRCAADRAEAARSTDDVGSRHVDR